MKPVQFKEQNNVYGKDQAPYLPLPAHRHNGDDGKITCCWSLTIWERLKLLVTGRLWQQVLTFNGPLQPQYLTVTKPLMVKF